MGAFSGVASAVGGAALVGLALLDIFYTVLFPGSGHGPVRRPLARGLRWAFGQSRHVRPRWRQRLLAYAGPSEVTVTLGSWFVLLLVGWAAIFRPALGSGVVAAQGATDRSWGTALYFSGYNLTTLGLGDLVATNPLCRALVVLEAASGFLALTLAVSYFVSVYGNLKGRNTFAMALHDRSGGTGRGAAVVCTLWREGSLTAALHLTSMAAELRDLVQTHSSYPVLRAFHDQRGYDGVPRILLTCLETTTLLRTTVALPHEARPELAGGALSELEAAAATMTERLLGRGADHATGPGQHQVAAWRRHHAEILTELAAAGVPVQPDSCEAYVVARTRWDATLARFADALLYDWPDDLRPAPGATADAPAPPASCRTPTSAP